nr:hypothetical protein [Tanacetum cinerariifolium]
MSPSRLVSSWLVPEVKRPASTSRPLISLLCKVTPVAVCGNRREPPTAKTGFCGCMSPIFSSVFEMRNLTAPPALPKLSSFLPLLSV